ncbi:hypothetical protein [Nocardiopsis sp. NRRL B-16309]|uniref:hypothetical protein n=1 Tax=Nocardiopsis sp. NRRL B-16309 TaxID=1519494 RepID=UPI0018D089B9|nr:hypothetical protein [Nocardiopsis sp. NRRL B-16309]
MPEPGDERWAGWAEHWMSAHVVPLWLAQVASEADVGPLLSARLAWRMRMAEVGALETSAPWLHQALVDAKVPEADVAEISRAVAADIARRRERLAELEVIAAYL